MRPNSQRRQRIGDGVADLRGRMAPARLLEADLGRGILDRLDHQHVAREMQLAALRIDLGADLGLAAVARARGLGDRVLHGGEHDPPIDRLFAGDRVGDLQQFEPLALTSPSSLSIRLNFAPVLLQRSVCVCVSSRRRRCSAPFARLARSSCLLRRSDSASSASVRTSLASIMSSIGSKTSATSPALLIAARSRTQSPSVPIKLAAKPAAAVDRGLHFHLGDVAGIAVEIRSPHQRPVDARRRNLQPIGALDRIGDIKHRRQRARCGLAVLDRHGAVRPFRHDLHGAAGKTGNAHPHQPIAEAGEHRLGERGDARRPPRLDDEPWLVGKVRGPMSSILCAPCCIVRQCKSVRQGMAGLR